MTRQAAIAFVLALTIATTIATANIVYDGETRRIDYVNSDFEDQLFLNIDVNGDDSEDFTFTILNSETELFLGGLDFTRNNGFIGDFDDNDQHIFRTFSEGDVIGPDLEEDIGFETFSFAEYVFDGDTGGGLAEQEVILGFGIFTSGLGPMNDEDGVIYGWMRVRFGELFVTEDFAPSNTFIEVVELAFDDTGAGIAAGLVPSPAAAATLGLAGLAGARRRR